MTESIYGSSAVPRTLYLLTACQAYMFICSSLLITVSALIGLDLATDKSLATLPLAIQFIAMMTTSIPASLFMGKWGRKVGFLAAGIIGICGACLALLAIYQRSLPLFCMATFCFGTFSAFGNYYRFTAPEVVPAEKKNVAISWVMGGGVIAAFIGPNLATWSQNFLEVSVYAGAFIITIGVYLASMLTVSFMDLPAPVAKPPKTASSRSLSSIVTQPVFLVAVICAAFGYGTMNLVMTATPLAMHHNGMVLSDTAFVIQWHIVAMFAPSFITGNLIDRFGILNILLIGAILSVVCVAINLTGHSVWHFWLALITLGIGWNFLFVGGTTLLTESYRPEEKTEIQAINDFIVFSVVSITALSSGTIHHYYGWKTVNLCVLPLLLFVVVCIFLLKRKSRQTTVA